MIKNNIISKAKENKLIDQHRIMIVKLNSILEFHKSELEKLEQDRPKPKRRNLREERLQKALDYINSK